MRARLLFGSVVLFAFFLSPDLMGQSSPSTEPSVGPSVRQEVDSEILNLVKNIKASKTRAQSFKALEKTEKQIGIIRDKAPRQIEPDEVYMDMLTASLKEIPRGKAFKPAKCDEYRSDMMVKFDPHGGDHPVDSIAKTLEVIKALCH